uniref:Uncharacterized protein n=1 Tax=Arundo donax TaxID=35708 RepID=A0A0A9AIH0_ARUDO
MHTKPKQRLYSPCGFAVVLPVITLLIMFQHVKPPIFHSNKPSYILSHNSEPFELL